MAKAVRFHKTGGPEVLVYEDVSVGDPGPDEARVKNNAIGLNFIDTYHRSGLYPLPLPSGVGSEAAGVVEAVGKNVTWVKPGDRVAYAGGPPGAYAEVQAGSRGPAGEDPRGHLRPDCGGGNAQGPDDAVPDPADLQGAARRRRCCSTQRPVA